jgi:flagellar motor switch protein FliG
MSETQLTPSQKAAAILVAMGKPAAGKLLKFFKQEELKSLMEGARALRTIPQADLERIVAEFEVEFAEGAGLLDSADKMDTIINEALSPEEVSAIMGGVKPAAVEGPAPIWETFAKLDSERLGAFMATEHPQTVAFVLSNLPADRAAGCLLNLEKPVRSDIVKRMLSLNKVPVGAKRLVEVQLQARLAAEGAVKASIGGQMRVASVLNEMDKGQADEVIRDLEQTGTTGLEMVRAQLFAFEDLPLLEQKSRVTLFDGIATDVVTLALRKADGVLAESVLSAISQRSRRMVESELSIESNLPFAEIVRARKSIAASAIRLANEGALQLPTMQPAAAA